MDDCKKCGSYGIVKNGQPYCWAMETSLKDNTFANDCPQYSPRSSFTITCNHCSSENVKLIKDWMYDYDRNLSGVHLYFTCQDCDNEGM